MNKRVIVRLFPAMSVALVASMRSVHNLSDNEREVLQDTAKPVAERKLFPGKNLVIDRIYGHLVSEGLIEWKRANPAVQQLTKDHYVITSKGKDALTSIR